VGGIRRIEGGWAVRVAGVASVLAQQAMSAGYAPPQLVLAYPAPGVTVPSDNATVVFHYELGDASDPLDLRSFGVVVDGVDRTSYFRATADAAWGSISDQREAGIRGYDVRARICSVRGVCSEVTAIVTVVGRASTADDMTKRERRRKLVDMLLEAARRLLRP
jgi:hypothetical protein